MALLGTRSTIRAQLARPEYFAPSLAYVDECFQAESEAGRTLAGLTAGQTERVELAGGAFALLQAYLTKPAVEGRWETHRAHIDIQAMIAGEELMEITNRERLIVDEDLTPGKDLIFYHPFDQGSALRFHPGYVGVYFPVDGHRGGLMVKTPKLVRKVVVKVPVGSFAG